MDMEASEEMDEVTQIAMSAYLEACATDFVVKKQIDRQESDPIFQIMYKSYIECAGERIEELVVEEDELTYALSNRFFVQDASQEVISHDGSTSCVKSKGRTPCDKTKEEGCAETKDIVNGSVGAKDEELKGCAEIVSKEVENGLVSAIEEPTENELNEEKQEVPIETVDSDLNFETKEGSMELFAPESNDKDGNSEDDTDAKEAMLEEFEKVTRDSMEIGDGIVEGTDKSSDESIADEINCYVDEVSNPGAIDLRLSDDEGYDEEDIRCGYCAKVFSDRMELDTHLGLECDGNTKESVDAHLDQGCDLNNDKKESNGSMSTDAKSGFEKPHVEQSMVTKEQVILSVSGNNDSFCLPTKANTSRNPLAVPPYRCDYCDMMFKVKKKLKLHYKEIHGETINGEKCQICGKLFAQPSTLRTHVMMVHEKRRDYRCDECDKAFCVKGNLDRHKKEVHLNVKNYQCDVCSKTFSQKGHLTVHVDTVHSKLRNHPCSLCDKAFGSKTYLLKHVSLVHEKVKKMNEECGQCGQFFPSKYALKVHTMAKHENVKFQCDLCDKTFQYKGTLSKHMKEVHSGSSKSIQCNSCDKVFSSDLHLRRHDKIAHLNKRECTCILCGKKFPNIMDLNTHTRVVHLKKHEHKCQDCGMGFLQRKSLTIHVQTMHEKVKHVCKVCGKQFSQEEKLNSHITVHEKKTKLDCHFCEKSYTTRTNLKYHEETVHNGGSRVSKCVVCKKVLSCAATLQKHIEKVHGRLPEADLFRGDRSRKKRTKVTKANIKDTVEGLD